jgi:murein DD-endopeptidase MepM/ murein hydrolase activator NlpD
VVPNSGHRIGSLIAELLRRAAAKTVKSGSGKFAWPISGAVTSGFGYRIHPILGGRRLHTGIDVAASSGTPIWAADGQVVYAGEQPGYGHVVILRHAGGLLTLYAHMGKVLVLEGARVRAGDPVAGVGQSGRTTGPHLHFEVREGTRPRNPLLYLR